MKIAAFWEDMSDDLRYAARSLRRNAGFTAAAILSLGLGVGLTASILAVTNSYLVRALPFPNSERLYRAVYSSPGQREPRGVDRIDWKSLRDVVEVADYSSLGRYILHTEKYPQEISSLECAPGSLEAIGVRAAIGRVFVADDYREGGEKVILISNAMWQERFGSSPRVLGSTIRVSPANSGDAPTEYRIVGVLPAGFRYVGNYIRNPADTALPRRVPRQAYLLRLPEGVPPSLAADRINRALLSVASEIPAGWPGVRVESVHEHYVRGVRPILVGLTVASGLVLLIVVTNIVVLMLLRALRRQKETAVRVALGAESLRIARLLMTEAMLICGIALVAGVALTAFTLRALGPQIEERLGLPVPGGVSALAMDGTVLLWITGIGVLIAVVVALLPMIGARPSRLAETLVGSGRGGTDRPRVRHARAALITLEVAASTTLLIAGGLMLRTVVHLMSTNLGYETSQVFRPRLQLPNSKYRDDDPASFARFYERLEQRLAAIPNVSFALSTFVPFWEPPQLELEAAGGTHADLRASVTAAGPDYFQTLGMALREGRAFTAEDRLGGEPVIVISESVARVLAPQGSALGTLLATPEPIGGRSALVRRRVVGVVSDIHQTHSDVSFNDVYIPFAQARTRFAGLYIRAAGSSQKWMDTVRTVVASIDRDVFVGPSPPLSMQSEEMLAGPRFITGLLSVFAVFAVLLAVLGIYGVTAYVVQQRQREIAIRVAIGATPGAVTQIFLRNAGVVLASGIAVGILGAGGVSRVLQSQLHGVERFDAWTIASACLLLVAAGLLASWLPARRIARTDPMAGLRAE